MTRKLLVLRHAKSDWNAACDDDRERPLAPRGRRACRTVGRALASWGLEPDLVLSSPARRAEDTARAVLQEAGLTSPLERVDEFYEAPLERVVARLRALPAHLDVVLVVGHEPTWSGLVAALQGGGCPRLPTAALACLATEGTWSRLGPGSCVLRWLVTPKLLRALGDSSEAD